MNIIKPKVELITEPDILKRIELAGRTAYKSEDKISDDSAFRFYKSLVGRGHESVLEHSNIIVYAQNDETRDKLLELLQGYERSERKYHFIRNSDEDFYCRIYGDTFKYDSIFSGNLRAWRNLVRRYQNEAVMIRLFWGDKLFEDIYNWDSAHISRADFMNTRYDPTAQIEILPYAPGKLHNIITARFTCDRAIANEFVRHRELSFTQESTRYVKYGDITATLPHWAEHPYSSIEKIKLARSVYENSIATAELNYSTLLDCGLKQEDARCALTLNTKAEIVITGHIEAWERFLALRDDKAAHPDARALAHMLPEVAMFNLKWWENQFDKRWWENG